MRYLFVGVSIQLVESDKFASDVLCCPVHFSVISECLAVADDTVT